MNAALWQAVLMVGTFKCLTASMCVTTPRFMTNDDQEGLASCKCLSGGNGLLPMVIRRGQPLANDDPEGPASCKWSSGGAGLLQMIIQRDRLLANGHPEVPAYWKWWSGGTGLLHMIIWRSRTLASEQVSVTRQKFNLRASTKIQLQCFDQSSSSKTWPYPTSLKV